VTHSMNGAVETRSNWKGLNAGLREVPSMAAMSFAVVGEGEDVPDTRERALKSDRDESHPLRFVRVPSKRHCQRNDLRVAETWKAPQKLARKRKTENLSIASVRKHTGHRGCLIRFYPNSYTN
jgi:hypothetical protein